MNTKITEKVVFSDIDGTLIDEYYSYKRSQPVIQQLLDLKAHIVLCSSKTSAEIEYYRDKLCIQDPYISENGAAIFIPKGYFKHNYQYNRRKGNFDVIELGLPYREIRCRLDRIMKKGAFDIVGFGGMAAQEIAEDSGLPIELALMAKQREYSEPFIFKNGDEKVLYSLVEEEGLSCTKGGRYYHLMGKHDKGKAVSILKKFYLEEYSSLQTFGVGDGPNDLPMLREVDKPFFIKEASEVQMVLHNLTYSVR